MNSKPYIFLDIDGVLSLDFDEYTYSNKKKWFPKMIARCPFNKKAVKKFNEILTLLPARVETDQTLQGTKLIIVRQGNVYTGIGRKDDRSILVIPLLSSSVSNSNVIEYLLLLHINFKENPPLDHRIKALGGKHEHIKNIVQENSLEWEDAHLDLVAIDELFGRSAEKIGEFIVAQMTKKV